MKRLLAGIALAAAALAAHAQMAGGVMESQRSSIAAITSGSINGTTVGATTPSTGAFTTLSASSTFTLSGTGPHALGGGTSTNISIFHTGTFSGGVNGAFGVYQNITLTPVANQPSYGYQIVPTINKAASGTHADFASLVVDPPTVGAGASTLTNASALKVSAAPTGATNNRALWVASGISQFDGGVKGSATNDSAAAGNIGELLTVTVASGSAVSLTTATSANVASLSVTAGDWDCSAQVTHNAAATTSVTLLQIGISATTATLPTQAGGSGIGTDPLAIFRQAAAVPGGALTTNITDVRVSLSGTTTLFLVANDTFTVSTMTAYGTLRCRRMR